MVEPKKRNSPPGTGDPGTPDILEVLDPWTFWNYFYRVPWKMATFRNLLETPWVLRLRLQSWKVRLLSSRVSRLEASRVLAFEGSSLAEFLEP